MSVKINIARPFGPYIAKISVPDEFISAINEYTAGIIENPKDVQHLDWSERLVGKTHQELKITDEVLEPFQSFLIQNVEAYLHQIIANGVNNYSTSEWKITRRNAWVVRSFAGDFNPMHVHNNADICMAGFTQTPDWSEELAEDAQDHAPSRGQLCFRYGNAEEWGSNLIKLVPEVGDCYIFPANLTHFVYPFKSTGERRSFSINFKRTFLKDNV